MVDLLVKTQNEPTKCVLHLSGGLESGGNTAVVLVSQRLTARTVSCGLKQTLVVNTLWLTFIEVCLPPTCLISIDFNEKRRGNCNSVDRRTNAKSSLWTKTILRLHISLNLIKLEVLYDSVRLKMFTMFIHISWSSYTHKYITISHKQH